MYTIVLTRLQRWQQRFPSWCRMRYSFLFLVISIRSFLQILLLFVFFLFLLLQQTNNYVILHYYLQHFLILVLFLYFLQYFQNSILFLQFFIFYSAFSIFPILFKGQNLTVTFPSIFSNGIHPNFLQSIECSLLSPIANTHPSGTVKSVNTPLLLFVTTVSFKYADSSSSSPFI